MNNDGGKAVQKSETAGAEALESDQERERDTRQQSGQGESFWNLKNWSVRFKLAAVLIIPLVMALTFGSLRAGSELNRAGDLQNTVDQVDVAEQVITTIQEVQSERTLMAGRMAAGSVDGSTLDEQMATVDVEVQKMRSAFEDFDSDDSVMEDEYEKASQRLEALDQLRHLVSDTHFPESEAFLRYTSILKPLLQLSQEMNSAVTDRDLLRTGSTITSLGQAKEYLSQQSGMLHIIAGHNEFSTNLMERISSAAAKEQAAIDQFRTDATREEEYLYTDVVTGMKVDSLRGIIDEASAHERMGQDPAIDLPRLSSSSRSTAHRIRLMEGSQLDQLRSQAKEQAGDASRAAGTFFGIMSAALVATVVLTVIIARSIIRPLRRLRSSALEVAHVQLPERVRAILSDPNPVEASRDAVDPVPITNREEIGEVARSFDVVHERAVRMAAEQALLRENVNGIFVNLSRRSQRLVERQLGIIDRLESDEQDAEHLASLFELDHLATRLRRNSESLLVLSGAGLTKSMTKPVSASDVIGAAVSEIEQYARVEIGTIPDTTVQGRVVHDLVHLLAELLDNATYFSEPETAVSMRAVVTRRDALALQITDRGVGMTEEQLVEANERLEDPPDLDVSVTRRMGLYVVARLAEQHGIEVRLRENEDIEGGVVARVVVPAELLAKTSASASVPPPSLPASEMPAQIASSPESSVPAQSDVDQAPTPPSPETTDVEPTEERSTRSEPDRETPEGNGLVPLDQPMSLDDLIGGANPAAGPFIRPEAPEQKAGVEETGPQWPGGPYSPEESRTETPHRDDGAPEWPGEEPQWPGEEPQWPEEAPGPETEIDDSPTEVWKIPAGLPKREPNATSMGTAQPAAPAQPENGDDGALDDEVPTKRLPIYQSVLSRWFDEDPPPDPESQRHQGEPGSEPAGDTGGDGPGTGDTDQWWSASDSGWEAANALLTSEGEERTAAGLPKRVPNSYLVPGSINPSQGDGFTDTTAGEPGEGALARSAEAARSRMMNFQRGYQSGRHALRESPVEGE